jgi:hypothetical protein
MGIGSAGIVDKTGKPVGPKIDGQSAHRQGNRLSTCLFRTQNRIRTGGDGLIHRFRGTVYIFIFLKI